MDLNDNHNIGINDDDDNDTLRRLWHGDTDFSSSCSLQIDESSCPILCDQRDRHGKNPTERTHVHGGLAWLEAGAAIADADADADADDAGGGLGRAALLEVAGLALRTVGATNPR